MLVKPAGADCNLACDYCFYRPKKVLYPDAPCPRMTTSTLEKLVAHYMGMAGPNPIFAWQGGEPALMGLDFFRQVVELQQRFGRPGQVVGNGFQTNATLLDDGWARFFADYSFLVGVSLDGPQGLHDAHRRTPDGQGTWAAVMAGIEALRRHGVEFNVLCMVTQESVRQPEKLFRFFRHNEIHYVQFIPLVEPGPEPLSPAPFSIGAQEYAEFLCHMFDQWAAEWPAMHIREFDEFLTVYAGRPQISCTFQETCGSYCVVEHTGDVYTCDFMVEPQWKLGNLVEQPLGEILTSPLFEEFAGRKTVLSDKCKACEWLALCHGGCQKHRLIRSRSVAAPSYFCEAYRRFFRHSRRRFRKLSDRIVQQQSPSRVSSPKQVGSQGAPSRNAPCPCGSGTKYKHCCLGRGSSGQAAQ
ncbi:MAG: anaerobic sulfatase maturase [Armatimonadetes bacterium]|nr:anaerobic sulfatase maturase [Armatimonadota bacterium]